MSVKVKNKTSVGVIRGKRGDILVKDIEETFGISFGIRSNKKLSTHLKDLGYKSLSELVKKM